MGSRQTLKKLDERLNGVKYVIVNKRALFLTPNSLNLFSLQNSFRFSMIRLVEWNRFDQAIILLIMLNSVFLGCMDYVDPSSDYWGNKLVEYSEPFFTLVFTLEAAIKIISYGLLLDKKCYLRDAWNWLDFIVVVTALLGVIPGMKNVSGLRTFRLFRPLRSLSALPSMRILVNTLLSSVVQLSNILALAVFFFAIFAILGISLWSGLIHQRCRVTPAPIDGDWLVVPGDT